MKGPRRYARGHCGEDNADVEVVDLVAPLQGLLRAQIEDAVSAQSGGRAVVQVKEPDRAVNDGEPHREQGVHGPDRQAVERKLQGLVG